MKFNLSNQYKKQSAIEYFNKLIQKVCTIEIKEIKPKRSIDQNSLYWLWLTCIQEETGQDKNELHLLYRAMFLQKEDSYITSIIRAELWPQLKIMFNSFQFIKYLPEIIDVISRSTTELDTKEFTDYLGKIQDHAAINMNVTLLTLSDKNFNDFYNTYIEKL